MSVDPTIVLQQSASQDAAARASAAVQLRNAVEQARVAEQAARDAARQAQTEARIASEQARVEARAAAQEARAAAMQAARAQADVQGLPMPPAPQQVTVRDGQVIVRDANGNIIQEIHTPGQSGLPPGFPTDMPPRVQETIFMFFVTLAVIAVGIPLARAFGRWVDRRGARPAALPADATARLQRIEEIVETMAVEVERISEGQRFTSRLMAEMRQLPQLEGVRAEGTRIPEPRR
jgi:hypothetical protein